MRVLAIDSSGLTATVAVVEETQTVAEYTINYKKTHSQTLLPMIDEVVKMTELDRVRSMRLQWQEDRDLSPDFGLVLRQRKGWDLH